MSAVWTWTCKSWSRQRNSRYLSFCCFNRHQQHSAQLRLRRLVEGVPCALLLASTSRRCKIFTWEWSAESFDHKGKCAENCRLGVGSVVTWRNIRNRETDQSCGHFVVSKTWGDCGQQAIWEGSWCMVSWDKLSVFKNFVATKLWLITKLRMIVWSANLHLQLYIWRDANSCCYVSWWEWSSAVGLDISTNRLETLRRYEDLDQWTNFNPNKTSHNSLEIFH